MFYHDPSRNHERKSCNLQHALFLKSSQRCTWKLSREKRGRGCKDQKSRLAWGSITTICMIGATRMFITSSVLGGRERSRGKLTRGGAVLWKSSSGRAKKVILRSAAAWFRRGPKRTCSVRARWPLRCGRAPHSFASWVSSHAQLPLDVPHSSPTPSSVDRNHGRAERFFRRLCQGRP